MKQRDRWVWGCGLGMGLTAATLQLVSACGTTATNGPDNGSAGSGGGGTSGGGGSSSAAGSGGGDDSGSPGALGSSSGSSGGGTTDGGVGHTDGSGSSSGSSSGGPALSGGCLQAGSGDYSKPGPYTVVTKSVDLADAGLASAASPTTFTIYYPSKWETSCFHPIAAWGNGTGVTGQTTYQFFNNNVASWGIVVIASDNSNVNASPYLSTGIDYLVAQSKDPNSIFYQKLSTKAGVGGHSQGGIAATGATTNPNVVSEVCIEGGGTPKQGTATLCLTGSITDGGLNGVNAIVVQNTYPTTTGPGFLADWDGGDHVTTPTAAGWFKQDPGTIQFVRLMTAWYRCFLASDGTACGLFKGGSSCGICKDPGWYLLESKNL